MYGDPQGHRLTPTSKIVRRGVQADGINRVTRGAGTALNILSLGSFIINILAIESQEYAERKYLEEARTHLKETQYNLIVAFEKEFDASEDLKAIAEEIKESGKKVDPNDLSNPANQAKNDLEEAMENLKRLEAEKKQRELEEVCGGPCPRA